METLIVNDSEKLNGFVDWTNGIHCYFSLTPKSSIQIHTRSNSQSSRLIFFCTVSLSLSCSLGLHHFQKPTVDHFSRQRFFFLPLYFGDMNNTCNKNRPTVKKMQLLQFILLWMFSFCMYFDKVSFFF